MVPDGIKRVCKKIAWLGAGVLLLGGWYGAYCYAEVGHSEARLINAGDLALTELRFDLGGEDRVVTAAAMLPPGGQRKVSFYPQGDGAYRLFFRDRGGHDKVAEWGYVTGGAGEFVEIYFDGGRETIRVRSAAPRLFWPGRFGLAWREDAVPVRIVKATDRGATP